MSSESPSGSQYFYVHLDRPSDVPVVRDKLVDILNNPDGMPSFDFLVHQMRARFGRAPIDLINLTRTTTARNLGQDRPHFPVLEVRGNEILDVMTALQFANRIAKVIEIH
ncbi:hypothetical protein KAZ92_01565 [Candidatus Gracilibacteria bacterium]|nr:hypothetical protein [Candidatus Gracilibacteria bacterium]